MVKNASNGDERGKGVADHGQPYGPVKLVRHGGQFKRERGDLAPGVRPHSAGESAGHKDWDRKGVILAVALPDGAGEVALPAGVRGAAGGLEPEPAAFQCGGVAVVAFGCSKGGPNQSGCADVAAAQGGVAPASVWILGRGQPAQTAADQLCIPGKALRLGKMRECDQGRSGRKGAAGKLAGPVPVGPDLAEQGGRGNAERALCACF